MVTRWKGVIAFTALFAIMMILALSSASAGSHRNAVSEPSHLNTVENSAGHFFRESVGLKEASKFFSPLSSNITVESVWINPSDPEYDDNVSVLAKVVNASSVTLNYTYTGAGGWFNVSMEPVKPVEGIYAYNLSKFPYGTIVYFQVIAENGNETFATSFYYFTVGDYTAPEITDLELSKNRTYTLYNVSIEFKVSEPEGASGIFEVWVDVYRATGSGWELYDTADMGAFSGNGTFNYFFSEGGTYRFTVNAADNAGNVAHKDSGNITVLERGITVSGVPDNITIEYGDPLSLHITVRENVTNKTLGNALVSVSVESSEGQWFVGGGLTDDSGFIIISVANTLSLKVGNYTLVIEVKAGSAFSDAEIRVPLKVVPEKVVFTYSGPPVQDDSVDILISIRENDGNKPLEMGVVRVYNATGSVYATVYGTDSFHFTLRAYQFNVTPNGILVGFSFVADNYDSSITWVLIPHRLPMFTVDVPGKIQQGETIPVNISANDPDGVTAFRVILGGETLYSWTGSPVQEYSYSGNLTVPIWAKTGAEKLVIEVTDLGGHTVRDYKSISIIEAKIILRVHTWLEGNNLHVACEAHYSSGYNASAIKVYVYFGSDYIVASFNGTHFVASRVIFTSVALRVVAFDDYGHESEYSKTVNYSATKAITSDLLSDPISWVIIIAIAPITLVGYRYYRRWKRVKAFEELSTNKKLGDVLSHVEEEEV